MLSFSFKIFTFAAGLAALLGWGAVVASTTEVTHPVPSNVIITVLPIQWSADLDFSGQVDYTDLLAVLARLNTPAPSQERVDINHDGVVDLVDQATVARYIGEAVEL